MAESTSEPMTPERATQPAGPADDGEVLDEVLVEEVSIDGMCGVY